MYNMALLVIIIIKSSLPASSCFHSDRRSRWSLYGDMVVWRGNQCFMSPRMVQERNIWRWRKAGREKGEGTENCHYGHNCNMEEVVVEAEELAVEVGRRWWRQRSWPWWGGEERGGGAVDDSRAR